VRRRKKEMKNSEYKKIGAVKKKHGSQGARMTRRAVCIKKKGGCKEQRVQEENEDKRRSEYKEDMKTR
jgi:hypothetical protein